MANPILSSCIINLARWSGFVALVLFVFRKRVVILTLHGVMDSIHNEVWQPTWPRTSIKCLDETLYFLSKRYQFVSMDSVADMLSGVQPISSYSLALTFDDGYDNNFTHAWPVLKKYNAHMIVYLATGYIKERNAFWVDGLDYTLNCLVGSGEISVRLGDESFTFNLQDRSSYKKSYTAFRSRLKSMKFLDDYEFLEAIKQVTKQLSAKSGKAIEQILEQDSWTKPVPLATLKNLDRNLDLGGHTVTHIRVTKVAEQDLRKELSDSKHDIEVLTQRPCVHFCYPSGDFDDRTSKIVKQEGYRTAVVSEIGTNAPGANLTQLKRISFPELSKTKNIDFWLAKELLREYVKSR